MTKKFYFIVLFMLLIVGTSYSQTFTLSGIVKDADNRPLPFANVAVYNTNKSLQNGVITLNDGNFMIENLPPAVYTVSISFMGYITHEEIISIEQSIRLPEITLKEDAINLQAVQIMGYRKLIKSDKGRTTLNVEGSMLASIPSITMIMPFVPGVTVQGEAIEVIGKGTPLIFINGREVKNPSQISSLQPERIKSITVDRNPSAKYDAQYTSVIEIVTIEQKKQELSVQLMHGSVMGNLYSHSETVNINHSTGKWTNFLSYKFKNERKKQGEEVYQNIYTDNIRQQNNYTSNSSSNQHIHSVVFGSNLKMNDKHNVDLQYFFDKNTGNINENGTETLIGKQNINYNVLSNRNKKSDKHTANLNYRWNIDSVSRLNIFADYTFFRNQNNDLINNTSPVDNAVVDNYALNNRSNFNTYTLRTEYSTKLFNSYVFNAGVRFSEIKSNTFSEIGKLTQNRQIENHSVLTEQTLSAYTTLSRDFGNLSVEAGLRAERNEGKYLKNDVSVFDKPRVLNNLFPSLSTSYLMSKNVRFNLNYTSKIVRPLFADLDPSVTYLSSVMYEQGNPELKPEINHTLELGGTFWDKLNLSVGYSLRKNTMTYLVESDNNNPQLLINRPVNLAKASTLDFNASYNLNLGKWNSNLIGNISVPFIEYSYLGNAKKNDLPKFLFVSTNTYMLSPNVFLIGNFIAQSRYSHLNNQVSPIYNLVLAANFVMFGGKMNLTVFGNDLLKKSEPNTYTEWGYVNTRQNVNSDTRQVGVIVKFNLNKFKTKFKQSNSNSEELKRIEKEKE